MDGRQGRARSPSEQRRKISRTRLKEDVGSSSDESPRQQLSPIARRRLTPPPAHRKAVKQDVPGVPVLSRTQREAYTSAVPGMALPGESTAIRSPVSARPPRGASLYPVDAPASSPMSPLSSPSLPSPASFVWSTQATPTKSSTTTTTHVMGPPPPRPQRSPRRAAELPSVSAAPPPTISTSISASSSSTTLKGRSPSTSRTPSSTSAYSSSASTSAAPSMYHTPTRSLNVKRLSRLSSDSSTFRLGRPEAVPPTFAAVRDSLQAGQIGEKDLKALRGLPGAWSSSTLSSTDELSEKDDHSAREEKERQKQRLSSLLTGLGLAFGPSTAGVAGQSDSESDGEVFESADEGSSSEEGGRWMLGHVRREREILERPSAAISTSESANGLVAFGYALDSPPPPPLPTAAPSTPPPALNATTDEPTSVKELVRQSWRLSLSAEQRHSLSSRPSSPSPSAQQHQTLTSERSTPSEKLKSSYVPSARPFRPSTRVEAGVESSTTTTKAGAMPATLARVSLESDLVDEHEDLGASAAYSTYERREEHEAGEREYATYQSSELTDFIRASRPRRASVSSPQRLAEAEPAPSPATRRRSGSYSGLQHRPRSTPPASPAPSPLSSLLRSRVEHSPGSQPQSPNPRRLSALFGLNTSPSFSSFQGLKANASFANLRESFKGKEKEVDDAAAHPQERPRLPRQRSVTDSSAATGGGGKKRSVTGTAKSNIAPVVMQVVSQPAPASQTWRSTMPPSEFEVLSTRYGALEMLRQEVIFELSKTEESFVHGLQGVIQVFSLPLRTSGGRWIKGVPPDVARLFDWLDDIVYLHSQIADALLATRSPDFPIVGKIAEPFLPFVARLEVHQPYLVRFESVIKAIDDMSADFGSDFGEFVRMQSRLPDCAAMSLSSFLLKPVQRLMKYPLFFKQLCELTPATHPDHIATLSLLHSTDFIIRVMQEVKVREEEYEEIKALEKGIRGLPDDFKLAQRDRRLIAHGHLRRVLISDRDRSVLELDTSPIQRSPARASSLARLASPALLEPESRSRPLSHVSDSGSSNPSIFDAGDSASSSWASPPPTPGPRPAASLSTATSGSLRPHSGSTFDSLTPSADYSILSDKSIATASSMSLHNVLHFGRGGSSTDKEKKVLRTRAKETSVHIFVFSDLVVLTTKQSEGSRFMRHGRKKDEEPEYVLMEDIGLARVLGVTDLSGKTEHEHLMEVALLPVSDSDTTSPLSLSQAGLATSIYLTVPARLPGSRDRATVSSLAKERARWLAAFERSYLFALRSLSLTSILEARNWHEGGGEKDRLSCGSFVAAGLPIPKSPSEQHLEAFTRSLSSLGGGTDDGDEDSAQREREERGWWATRLKKVRKELEQGIRAAECIPAPSVGLGIGVRGEWA